VKTDSGGGGRESEVGGEGEAGRTEEVGRIEGTSSGEVSGSEGGVGVEAFAVEDFEVVLREIETEREGGFEGGAGEGEGEEETPAEDDDAAALAVAEALAASRWAREEGRAGRG